MNDKQHKQGRPYGSGAGINRERQYAEEAEILGKLTDYGPFTSETLMSLDPAALPTTLAYKLAQAGDQNRRSIIGVWVSWRARTGHIKLLGTVNGHQRLYQVVKPASDHAAHALNSDSSHEEGDSRIMKEVAFA